MIPRSRHLPYKIALLGGILLLLGYVTFKLIDKINQPASPTISIHPRAKQSQMTLKGMTYSKTLLGEAFLVMKVSSLEVGKKKWGFFRVGGLKQVELQNVEVDYHEPPPVKEGRAGQKGQKGQNTGVEEPGDLHSGMLAAAQSFGGKGGRIAGFRARGVRFHYHHTDGTQTDIEGDLLEIEWSDKSLRIRGNAHVRHAGRSLSTDEIDFQPQDKTFFTKKNYTLTTNGESQRGREIRTDLFLNPLPVKTMKENRVVAGKDLNKVDGGAKYFENKTDSNR